LLWFLFFITFTLELVKIDSELSPGIGHQQLGWANAFFWSSLFFMEIIMAGMILYYIVRNPARRKSSSLFLYVTSLLYSCFQHF
ncbi:MAG: hypothetical protein KAJ00_07650, partial [Deltaproteobacteria bacterium]|nr:hypothetical protein [Deltaproteobacteria bacterium]